MIYKLRCGEDTAPQSSESLRAGTRWQLQPAAIQKTATTIWNYPERQCRCDSQSRTRAWGHISRAAGHPSTRLSICESSIALLMRHSQRCYPCSFVQIMSSPRDDLLRMGCRPSADSEVSTSCCGAVSPLCTTAPCGSVLGRSAGRTRCCHYHLWHAF